MGRETTNVPHLLAQYLFRHVEGRKSKARFGNTWAWVASGPERQHVAAAGAYEINEAGSAVDEGLRGVVESFTTKQYRVSTELISCMTQLMDDLDETMIWYILKKTCVELIRAF
ncbi:hypothetical protein Tco_0401546 [Tanacetum coccineum]